jgi:hypothetical protein
MPLSIEHISTPSAQTWDAIWKADKYATYYQSREWAELWSSYSNRRLQPAPLQFQFSDGVKVLIPFSRKTFPGGIYKRYIASVPKVTTGGWLSKDTMTGHHISAVYEYLTQRYKNVTWRLNAFDPVTTECKLPSRKSSDIHTVDLQDDFESVFKRFSKGHRQAVNKAEREGIRIEQSEKIEEWKYFMKYTDLPFGDGETMREWYNPGNYWRISFSENLKI